MSALCTWECLPDNPPLGFESTSTGDDSSIVESVPSAWVSLLDPDAWEPTSIAEDPQNAHRPAAVECSGGWGREGKGIEIDTKYCNYLSLSQPTLARIERGDDLYIEAWWQVLASIDPAQAHVALYVGEALVWEEYIPIPSDADIRTIEFHSPIDAPAGYPLTLHLHNHGYNTWRFNDLSVRTNQP